MIWLWTALALAAPEGETAEAPPVVLITTGATGGIVGSSWHLGEALSEMELESVQPMHGVMARSDEILIAKDGRVETVQAVLDGGECEDAQPAVLARSPFDVIVSETGDGDAYQRWSCGENWWYAPEGQAPTDDRDGFEFRLTVRAELTDGTSRYVVALPVDDAPRRISRILELKQQHPNAIFVDSGSFVDGVSTVRDHMPSLHRPTLFEALRRMEPAALAPGATELASGASSFLKESEGLPYVATNWVTDDEDLAIPSVQTTEVEIDGKLVKIAFLAALDPTLASSIPALVREGVTLSDPIEAVRAALVDLDAEVVVLLTEGRRPWLADLERMPGVDLVVGDPGPPMDRVTSFDAHVIPGKATAWTMSIDGIGVTRLYLDDHGLHRLVGYPEVPWTGQTPDATVLERVNDVRFREYPEHDRPLLAAPAAGPTEALSQETWEKIVCESVLEYTDAHVALLPALPLADEVPGPLTELLVLNHLGLPDELEVHWIRGENLARTLDQGHGAVPVACGGTLGDGKAPVDGRGIDPLRLYKVATTDGARLSARLEGLLSAARSPRALDLPGWKTLTDDDGPVTLRRATIEILRRHHEADPVAVLTSRSSADLDPLWLLRIEHAAFSAVSFRGVENPAFDTIPETLATSPSSLTLLADLDLGVDYSSAKFRADFRNKTSFSKLRSDGEVAEPADDLRFSSSGALPMVTVKVLVAWYPYSEMLFDSELTPFVDEETGVESPRQSDLSLTTGIMGSEGIFSRIRFGLFALQELANLGKQPEFGGRSEVTAKVAFGPALTWSTGLDGYLFYDTPDQDETDLRFKALVDTRLDLPLARWLAIAPWGQAFAFAGRVPATSAVGVSWTSGVALNMNGAFEL